MSTVARYLFTEVYPRLDAVAEGLLDHLEPRPTGSAYLLTCPSCSHPLRAFYYPGRGYIVCNRRNNCQARWSLWDILSASGWQDAQIVSTLCSSAGVSEPNGDSKDSSSSDLARSLTQILRSALHHHDRALAYLTQQRGLTANEVSRLPLGYYPGRGYIEKALSQAGADLSVAKDWHIIPDDDRESPFANRIVGWWVQPDGSVRLWGRSLSSDSKRKYYFAEGLRKSVPYLFQHPRDGTLICTEGPFDALSMHLLGYTACAVGGTSVSRPQADFLAYRGVRRVLFVLDSGPAAGDGALRTVRECESLGITTLFAGLSDSSGDVDALRQAGSRDAIRALVDDAVTGGEYVANRLLEEVDGAGRHYAERAGSLQRLRSVMTMESALAYDRTLSLFGVGTDDLSPHALRDAAALLDAGLTLDEVRRRINGRYLLDLVLDPVASGANR